MSLSQIILDSIKYPFSDLTKFFIVGIIALLAGISSVFSSFGVDSVFLLLIGAAVSLIFTFVLSGYGLSVLKNAMSGYDEVPDLDPATNFMEGIKVFVINFVYFLIPLIITVILALITGAIGQGLHNIFAALGVTAIVAIILFIFFAFFEIIALARFAKTNELSDAFNLSAVFEDMKSIGILKILALTIIVAIVILIAYMILSVLNFIPYIGIIIAEIIAGAFVLLFYNRAIGLLCADL